MNALKKIDIEDYIYLIRGQKVILDEHLAFLYGIQTKALNQGVKRNIERFPEEFAFKLNNDEWKFLRSQIVTLEKESGKGKYRKYLPYAFTEHGALMAANILKSPQAIHMSLEIIRTFVRLRHFMQAQTEIMKEVGIIKEFVLKSSQKTDQELRKVWAAIEKLTNPPKSPEEERKIGFELKH